MPQDRLLDTASIIESAEVAAGVSGLVDDALRRRVDRLAESFRAAGPFTIDQQIATRRQLVKLLARRLGIARDVAAHPEILDEVVEAPVFIIGFPRTGTSIMHALLAADPANQATEIWQTREPSPPPGERPVTAGRRLMAAHDLERFVDRCPGLLALHPYWDEWDRALAEDDEIMALDFRTTYPTLFYDAPVLSLMQVDDDWNGNYRFMKLFMQHQQWRAPRRRWIMKGVEHQRYLSCLFQVFPDAHCLFPHREPETFMPSNLAIASVVYDGINGGAVDRKTFGPLYFADFRRRLQQMMNDGAMDDPRVRHTPFKDFIADPVAMLRRFYGEWGFEWTQAGEDAMRSWLANPANDGARYGRYRYTFEPYGVDWAAESPAFDAYRVRYLDHADVRQAGAHA